MKFTTPVSMPCTEAQYNELKPLLEAMGYFVTAYTDGFICTNYDLNNRVGTIKSHMALREPYTYTKGYYRDLFLALAAMTDEPNGIAGEWWKCIEGYGEVLIKNNLYKQFADSNTAWIKDSYQRDCFTKATVAEIFAHFGVSEGKAKDEPIQPEIPQPTPFQGIDRRTYLAGCIASNTYGKMPIHEIVEWTDKLIFELDKTK